MSELAVLMTVFNGGEFLEPAVESILNQSLNDFRFIIVNDGSTDQTADYLDSLDDERIDIIHQANMGTAPASNRGLKLVDAPFVARMDADDISMPHRLQRQLEFMKANPQIGIVGTQAAQMGRTTVGKSLKLPTSHRSIFACLMRCQHVLTHSSLMIRTKVLRELGGYWEFPLYDDWDMMLRVGEVSELANLDEVLLHYRVHAGSLTADSQRTANMYYWFAIERARRRHLGIECIDLDEFKQQRESRPIWENVSEYVYAYAMTHYRLAIADIHGGHPIRGRLRLGWSAVCAPQRALHRVQRMLFPG